MRLGIDFGTTRTVVACADRGNYPVLAFIDDAGDSIDWIPSVVAEVEGKLRFGFDALAVANEGAVVRSFKRLLADEEAALNQEVRIGSVAISLSDLVTAFLASVRDAIRTRSVSFHPLGRLSTAEVEGVLEDAVLRMTRYLRRRGLLDDARDAEDTESDSEASGLAALAATAVSGMTPPGGPAFRRGALPLPRNAQDFDRHLAVGRDGFTLHAATRAGAADPRGRETLLKYILRPPIAQERITRGPDGLVRIALKKAFSDGTVAIDLDPLSLLTRFCAAVPPPRRHTVRYVGVLASASKLRPRIVPTAKSSAATACELGVDDVAPSRVGARYWPWAELLKRTFAPMFSPAPAAAVGFVWWRW